MTKDPIVEDVRAAREKLFDACNGDLDAFLRLLKEQEQQDRSRLVSRKDMRARRKRGKELGGQPDNAADPASMRTREL
jgi:hypothetical protein